MKITIMTGLLAERDMYVDAGQAICDLMNNFTEMNTIKAAGKIKWKDHFLFFMPHLLALMIKKTPAAR